ncbi:RNA polymerase sigma factor [Nocardia sp. NBC_01388]|uniref:RNA polymerase sigma factor n=1 Tax=Nocardia sp. NBC_01388 TaxID=2903596 RepID=UPI00324A0F4C
MPAEEIPTEDHDPNGQQPPPLADEHPYLASEELKARRFGEYFGCTIEQAFDWVLDQALRRTKNAADAEDIAQKSLLKLWIRCSGDPLTARTAEAYVRGTVNNVCATQWKKQHQERERAGTRVGFDIAIDLHGGGDVEPTVFDDETIAWTNQAIPQLPPHLRDVVELLWDPDDGGFDARTLNEVAQILGIPRGTAGRRWFDARKELRALRERFTTETKDDPK